MPSTFYLDPVNGGDAADGSTWSLVGLPTVGPWKTFTSGATAARTAPGDTIRIAKSPDPTSLGQTAVWTSAPTTIPGTVGITSSTDATPIVVTKNGHGLANGTVVQILGHTVNTNANGTWVIANVAANTFELVGSVGTGGGAGGATGTYQNISHKAVVLQTAAVTTHVSQCEANWTAGPNVTSANRDNADWKEGAYSVKIITAAGHAGAGQLAYWGLPGSIDLSGYRQISFWIRNVTTALASGDLQIRLYSNAACTDPANLVETLTVPAVVGTNSWVSVTIDKGSALSATVQGIAVYATIAMASKTIYVDNFLACKDSTSADSLTLNSLISKNSLATGGTEGWYALQSINGTILLIDNHTNCLANAGLGYSGATSTATTYKRECSYADPGSLTIQEGGTPGLPITYSGGWNTGTNSKDGETYLTGRGSIGAGILFNKSYIVTERLSNIRYQDVQITGIGCQISLSQLSHIARTLSFTGYNYNNTFTVGFINNSLNVPILDGYKNNKFYISEIRNNLTSAWLYTTSQTDSMVFNTNIVNNTGITTRGDIYFNNCNYVGATLSSGLTSYSNLRFVFKNWGKAAGNRIYTDSGVIVTDDTTRHTASGVSWKLSPTAAARDANYPLDLKIAEIAVNTGTLVTVSAYMMRDNAGITGSLVCRAGQDAGPATQQKTDLDDSGVGGVNNWALVTITWTPSVAGVVEIECWAYGGTTYNVWVDDLTITQA